MQQIYDHPIHVGWDEASGREIVIADTSGATSSELPSVTTFAGFLLHEGSRFWDISTGDIYGMVSNGTWNKQDHNPGPPIW